MQEDRYLFLAQKLATLAAGNSALELLYAGKTFRERWNGFSCCHVPCRPWQPALFAFFVVQVLCLTPNVFTDFLVDVIMRVKQCGHKVKTAATINDKILKWA